LHGMGVISGVCTMLLGITEKKFLWRGIFLVAWDVDVEFLAQ